MLKNKNNKNLRRITSSDVAIIGTVITLIGAFFLSYNYVQAKKIKAYDYVSNIFFEDEQKVPIDIPTIVKDDSSNNEIIDDTSEIPNNQEMNSQYIGYLYIPKINLYKGFVDKSSTENDVDKNIFVANTSSYPDTKGGNLIIAGHSGTGWRAFFNNLYKLTANDIAVVTYNNKKYTYKITNIYKQEKTGKIVVYRDQSKTTLTLVTCTNNDSKTQTIYILELQTVE